MLFENNFRLAKVLNSSENSFAFFHFLWTIDLIEFKNKNLLMVTCNIEQTPT